MRWDSGGNRNADGYCDAWGMRGEADALRGFKTRLKRDEHNGHARTPPGIFVTEGLKHFASLIRFGVRILPMVTGLMALIVGQILVVRGVGREVFGEFSYIMAWIGAATIIAKAGYEYAAAKVLPRLQADGAYKALRRTIGIIFFRVTRTSFLAMAGLAALITINPLGEPDGVKNGVLCGIPLVFLMSINGVRTAVAGAIGKYWMAQIPDNVVRPLLMGGVVLAMARFNSLVDGRGLVVVAVAVYLIISTIGFGWTWLKLPAGTGPDVDSDAAARGMTAVAGYMGLTNIFTGIVRNANILIVGNYVSLAELAVYVAASRMTELMNLVYMLLDPIAVPQFSRMDHAGNLGESRRIASNYVFTSASIGVLLWLLFAIFGSRLLSLYGPGFSGGATVMLLMATAYLTNSTTGPASQILAITGLHRLNFYITVVATLLYLLALGILTSRYGIAGAAVSMILYQTVRNFSQALFVWKLKRVNTMVFGARIGRGSKS